MNPIVFITTLIKTLSKTKSAEQLFKTFLSQSINKKFDNDLDFMHYLSNPNNVLKDIKKIPQDKVNNLVKDFNQNFSNKNKESQDKLKNINEFTYTNLSSSWLKKGKLTITNKSSLYGVLTIMINSDKNPKWYGPYTYPLISIKTWELMKEQKGKNGSGAGTIFWRYFLDVYYPSQFRQYAKQKINKGILSINDFNKIESGFYRTKNKDINNSIDNKLYKNNLQIQAKQTRQQLKNHIKKELYKNAKFKTKTAIVYKSTKQNIRRAKQPLKSLKMI